MIFADNLIVVYAFVRRPFYRAFGFGVAIVVAGSSEFGYLTEIIELKMATKNTSVGTRGDRRCLGSHGL